MPPRAPSMPVAEAAQLRVALDAFLKETPREVLARTLPREAIDELPATGEPFIDDAGVVRVGAWWLQSPGGVPQLASAFRFNPDANVRLTYVAAIERRDGAWRVLTIDFERAWRAR